MPDPHAKPEAKEAPDFDPAETAAWPELDPTGNVDLSQIDCNLLLTPAQRIQQLIGMLEFVRICREARIKRYGFDPATPADLEAA